MSVRVEDPERTAPLAPEFQKLLAFCDERRTQARHDRRKYESTWTLCKSFLAGRQWVGIHPRTGRVMKEQEFENREKHTVNVITQYHQTVLGKLIVEDLRPPILFARNDLESESIATHTSNVAKYLWDTEVDADGKVYMLVNKMLTFGTAALRCSFDPSQGKLLGEVPVGEDGEAIVDLEEARAYMAEAMQQGIQPKMKALHEGREVWESLSPQQFLPPPGVEECEDFPWLIIETAMSVEKARMRFPEASAPIRPQSDIASLDSLDGRDMADDTEASPGGGQKRLKDHLVVSTMYEMPTLEHPEGRVIIWNSANKILLEIRDELPYTLKGRAHHGIIFFHYHRVPGRFLGYGLVEPLIGPQRQKNRARSQMIEMKDRNLGRVYARKGTITAANRPVGKIMELIEIPLHADFPQETNGIPPGSWIENEARLNDEDMDRVAGLGELSLGNVPAGVSAYASMALIAEQDERRVGPVLKGIRKGLGDAMLLSLEMAKTYWQEGKQFAIAGTDGVMEVYNFSHAQFPLEFYVDVSKHAPLPTSPAVESQKIFDLFHAATSAGQPLPIDWLKDSLDQGKALPIPKREEEVQIGKAEQENLMMYQGMQLQPAYYDDDYIHIQVHRQAQEKIALQPGAEQMGQLLEMHIQMHAQNAAMKKPTSANSIPQDQGGHGIEAQNGKHANMQGAAQSASQGTVPPPPSGGQ